MTSLSSFFPEPSRTYPPCVAGTSETLGNKLYTKAEKFHVSSMSFLGRIESRQVSTDPEKIHAVSEWPKPMTLKQLQQLNFANFYQCFIRDYCWMVVVLTKLTSPLTPFTWTPEADLAFAKLKRLFISVLVLVQPDSAHQLIVEVDASDTGVGAVFSQCSIPDLKLHSCAYCSHWLTSAGHSWWNLH